MESITSYHESISQDRYGIARQWAYCLPVGNVASARMSSDRTASAMKVPKPGVNPMCRHAVHVHMYLAQLPAPACESKPYVCSINLLAAKKVVDLKAGKN